MNPTTSRRNFLAGSTGFAAAGFATLANPIAAAAQSVDVKPGDLPDLTIKEVKVYVTDISKLHKLNGSETGELISVVTNSGIEGNYTIGDRDITVGWLDWAKPALVGKSIIDLLPTLTSTTGMKARAGFDGPVVRRPRRNGRREAPARERDRLMAARQRDRECLRAAAARGRITTPRRPMFACGTSSAKLLTGQFTKSLSGGAPTKERMMAYASSQHLPTVEDYVPDVLKAKELGYKAYKIHPGQGQHATGPEIPSYIGHMEEIREVRKAVGDEFVLMHDPVQQYNRFEAMAVGRLLDELNYAWFEDPVRYHRSRGSDRTLRGIESSHPCG